MSDTPPAIVIQTHAPYPIERRRLEDDPELAPNAAIVGAFINGKIVARTAQPEEWEPELDGQLFAEPRLLQYHAHETEPGQAIAAELYAVVPAAALDREPWQPTPGDDEVVLVLLGSVVRLAVDRKDRPIDEECVDHMNAILRGAGVPVADRVLDTLLG